MQIVILPEPEGDTIAWEEQLGERDARFILADDGSIRYRNRHDDRVWFVAATREQFLAAAKAWNRYSQGVLGKSE